MSEALKEYKVAAINCEPKMFEKENNLKKQYALVEEAAKNGARLIALLIKISKAYFTELEQNKLKIYMETQKTQNCQSYP